MNIVIISASSRPNSNSLKFSNIIRDKLAAEGKGIDLNMIDLNKNVLPFFDASLWMGDKNTIDLWEPTRSTLEKADGLIFVTPEWNGMSSPALSNMLMYVKAELSHKPVLIVSVSATSHGGSYPVSQLRAFSSKNNRFYYIPEHMIIRNANTTLKDWPNIDKDNADDSYISNRIDYCLNLLQAYAKASISLRSSGLIDHQSFEHGM